MAPIRTLIRLALTFVGLLSSERRGGVRPDAALGAASGAPRRSAPLMAGHPDADALSAPRAWPGRRTRGAQNQRGGDVGLLESILAEDCAGPHPRGEPLSVVLASVGTSSRWATLLHLLLAGGIAAGAVQLARGDCGHVRRLFAAFERSADLGDAASMFPNDASGPANPSRAGQTGLGTSPARASRIDGSLRLPPADGGDTPAHGWEVERDRWWAEVWDRSGLEEVIAFARDHLRGAERLGAAEETVSWIRPVLYLQQRGYDRDRLSGLLSRVFRQSINSEGRASPPFGRNASKRWGPWLIAAIEHQLGCPEDPEETTCRDEMPGV